MITRIKVDSVENKYFEFCWNLYVSAFPEEERRAMDYHLETMVKPSFCFDIVLVDGVRVGILAWWDLSEFRYIEHFATDPSLRGQGYGDKILRDFISESEKPLILEVEHPVSEIEKRRVGFYERIGLVLNQHYYAHPSYDINSDAEVSLMIMTYPNLVSEGQLRQFVEDEFPVIHFGWF